MRRALIATVSVAALVLAGCGGDDEPEAISSQEATEDTDDDMEVRDEGGPAEYLYVDAYGGLVTVDLSTQDFSNEMTDEANAVRELQGHESLTWYRVEIDNREGAADVSLDSIQVVTVDGETIDAAISTDNLPELPEMDGENGVYNRNVYAQHAFINSYPDGLPGSIGETQVTFPGLDDLDSIRFVYVNGERADPN